MYTHPFLGQKKNTYEINSVHSFQVTQYISTNFVSSLPVQRLKLLNKVYIRFQSNTTFIIYNIIQR